MHFSHNRLKTTAGICLKRFKGELLRSVLPFLYGNVHGCRPVSITWTKYNTALIVKNVIDDHDQEMPNHTLQTNPQYCEEGKQNTNSLMASKGKY